MKFLCGSCRTKYQISDEKVRGKVLTIRCKKCGSKVLVKESLAKQGGTIIAPTVDEAQAEGAQRSAAAAGGVTSRAAMAATLASAFDVAMRSDADDMPTSIGPAPSKEEDAGVEWYIAVDGNQMGPFAYAEVVRRIRAKEVAGKHYVWHDGFDAWKRIRDVQDLSMYLPAEKKKPPPPPPTPVPPPADEDNKVVDIAVKRAERERRASQAKAPSTLPAPEPEVYAPAKDSENAESPTIAAEGLSAGDGRAQQLDRVLDEALGLPSDEGSVPLSASSLNEDASALRGVVGIESSVLAPDAFSEGEQHDHIPENLFDQVPRASEQELVSRESTKFFVRAAGMEQRRSRQRMALLAGVAATASVLIFFGMWAMGIIQISLPVIGNPFLRAQQEAQEQVIAAELSEQERRRVEALEKGDRAAGRVVDRTPRAGGGGGGGGRPRLARAAVAGGPGGDYIVDEQKQEENGRRGDEVGGSVGIDGQLGTSGGAAPGIAEAHLPQADVAGIEVRETGKLDQAMIREVVNARKSSVTICYQRELKGNQDLRGKLEFLVTVQPTGDVSRATVETAAFKGTALAACIADKIKAWRFPAFQGEAQNVFVPFVLQGGSSF